MREVHKGAPGGLRPLGRGKELIHLRRDRRSYLHRLGAGGGPRDGRLARRRVRSELPQRIHQGFDLRARHRPTQIRHRPPGLEDDGLIFVDIVHHEDPLAEAGESLFHCVPVESGRGRRRGALEPLQHPGLIALGLQAPEKPRAGVGERLVVEIRRVLRGQNHKRTRQEYGLQVNGDLLFLHALQQGGLGSGHRPIDFIDQDDLGNDRARPKFKGESLLVEIVNTGHIRG